jgi:type I restriction enzyme S subunit
MGHINRGPFLAFPVPIPPLAEQKRIVAKVDELMALCDRLEAQLKQRDEQAGVLAKAAVARFQADPTVENLEYLFHPSFGTAPEQLRTSILHLAVRRRLVAPAASTALQVELGEIVDIVNGRAYAKEELLLQGTPVLRVGNLFTSKQWYYSDLRLPAEKYCDEGDLLYAWSASFGPFIWKGPRCIFHYHIWKLVPKIHELNLRYLYWFLQEKTAEIKAAGHGVSMVHMTKAKMERISLELPGIDEQNQIVAKVDELMALVDQLESQITASEEAGAKLLDALVAELAPSN